MNKRIRKCLKEEDQIDKKIAELLSQKADLEVARGQEEEKEIIKAIRGLKLEKHELADLLEGIQSGEVNLLKSNDHADDDDGSTDAHKGNSSRDSGHAPKVNIEGAAKSGSTGAAESAPKSNSTGTAGFAFKDNSTGAGHASIGNIIGASHAPEREAGYGAKTNE